MIRELGYALITLTFVGLFSYMLGQKSAKDQVYTITEGTAFVVQEIRAKDGQWIYTLENINLQSSNELPILTIQTSVGYGYKIGDTLQVLNYNIPKRNLKLQ